MEGKHSKYSDGIKNYKTKKDNGSKTKKRKKSSGHVLAALLLLLIIFIVSVWLAGVIIGYGRDMLGISDRQDTIVVTVDKGATVSDIAYLLKDKNIISKPKFFIMFSKLSKQEAKFKAGDHEVRPNMAYETLIDVLCQDAISDKNAVKITFKEGITIAEAAQKLEVEGVCKADDFIEKFNSAPKLGLNYESHLPKFSDNKKFYRMEGYLFPDTYQFYKDEAPDLVCQKILENFDSKITDDMYEKMDKAGLSLDKTLTFASLVQKEVANTRDMKKVASVFWNRLKHKDDYPRLQSDTTNGYIEDVIKPNSGDSINQDIVDAYDTYKCSGLPAGAICSPGIDAIKAVLDPDDTDYYFFISDTTTGKTYFSKTYDEHESIQESIQGPAETDTELVFDEYNTIYVAGQESETATEANEYGNQY